MAHPRKFDDKDPRLKRVRKLCLDLPDTFEKEAWGECTFRVDGGTIFAMTDWNHHGSGHTALWIKAPLMTQGDLVQSDPERYFVPPYMGPKGWVGARLDAKTDWSDVQRLVEDAYRLSVPKRKKKVAQAASSKRVTAQKSPARKSAKKKLTKRTAKKAAKRMPAKKASRAGTTARKKTKARAKTKRV